MPNSSHRADSIRRLVEELSNIEDRLSDWQKHATGPDIDDIRAAQEEYASWFTRASQFVDEKEEEQFRQMHEGSMFRPRVRSFLTAPREESALYNPEKEVRGLPRWQFPFERSVRDSFAIQREILTHAAHSGSGIENVFDELESYFRKLPQFLSVLDSAENENVPSPNIVNERDLQTLVHGLLRMLYDDVRPEDFVPSSSGARSRVDFLLRESGIVIETKMTRAGLNEKKVGEEILIDWGRYPGHPDCKGLFALIYDPERRIVTPASLEHDLSKGVGSIPTRAMIIQ